MGDHSGDHPSFNSSYTHHKLPSQELSSCTLGVLDINASGGGLGKQSCYAVIQEGVLQNPKLFSGRPSVAGG